MRILEPLPFVQLLHIGDGNKDRILQGVRRMPCERSLHDLTSLLGVIGQHLGNLVHELGCVPLAQCIGNRDLAVALCVGVEVFEQQLRSIRRPTGAPANTWRWRGLHAKIELNERADPRVE